MRRSLMYLALAGAFFFSVAWSCTDDQARSDIAAMKTALNTWFVQLDTWNNKVYRAVCQLEADVYAITDSGGDIREPQGPPPPQSPGDDRLCPTGPGDPTGDPPDPPPL